MCLLLIYNIIQIHTNTFEVILLLLLGHFVYFCYFIALPLVALLFYYTIVISTFESPEVYAHLLLQYIDTNIQTHSNTSTNKHSNLQPLLFAHSLTTDLTRPYFCLFVNVRFPTRKCHYDSDYISICSIKQGLYI